VRIDPNWWKDLFDEFYLRTDARSVDDERLTYREVDFLEEVFSFSKSEPILDLCGGQGRHALELSRRGFCQVVLLDYSETLVRIGKRKAAAEKLGTVFIRADARAAAFSSQTFRVVMILGSSFGYFIDETENRKMLQEAARILKPGGVLLMDLPDREYVLKHFKPVIRHRIDASLERLQLLGRLGALAGSGRLVFLVKTLCVHEFSWGACRSGPGPATGSRFEKRPCSGFRIGSLICHAF